MLKQIEVGETIDVITMPKLKPENQGERARFPE